MTELRHMVSFLGDFLEAAAFQDAAINGLQVEGRGEVSRLALGVSASLELFQGAKTWSADAILVHHGLLWSTQEPIVGPLARRLRELLTSDMSLLAYHLPLDAHPEVGNNAQLAKRLGLADAVPWGIYRGKAIGQLGTVPPLDPGELLSRVATTCRCEPLILGERRAPIERIAVCSGGAGSMLGQAIDEDVHAFITGEPGEPALQLARETGTTVIGAGHYNTERLGVQALGERLERELNVEVRFFDLPNPV